MNELQHPRVHLVLPAAGIGHRFGQPYPKQYTQLAGKTLLEWTLDAWSDLPEVAGERILVLSGDDTAGLLIARHYPGVRCTVGGVERAHSVLAGLQAINAPDDDWVMVHDVARPCVRQSDILSLLAHCQAENQGALLARPVTDTVKRQETGRVTTVDRRSLWTAMTPQCFRYGLLRQALETGLNEAIPLTDEASAMEWLGEPVGLVVGAPDNIKVTHPDDLALVGFYLTQQRRLVST